MYVRLAFSVAAHMDHDILIIDEVLAVGDAEFQKKCLGKMDEITKKEGRTILFVSHNLSAIKSLCTKTILLEAGKITASGDTEKVINKYLASPKIENISRVAMKDRLKRTSGIVQFQKVKGIKDGKECWDFFENEEIRFQFNCIASGDAKNLLFYMALFDTETNMLLSNLRTPVKKSSITSGENISFEISIPPKSLRGGEFSLYFALGNTDRSEWYDVIDNNVGLPLLRVKPDNTDADDTVGIFNVPFTLHTND